MAWKTGTWPIFALTGVAFGAAVLGAGRAEAALFDVVRSNASAVTVIDPSAVEAVPGDGKVRRVRSVAVQRSITADGPRQAGYVSTISDYDCLKWRSRWRAFSVYTRFGALVLHKDNAEAGWTPIYGDPEAEATAPVVCNGGGAANVYSAASIGELVTALLQTWDDAEPLPPLQPVAPLPAKKPKKPPPQSRP
ncbi:hypothetical protein [Phenylobacterium sp.]|uniref:hypothetical protein n=1 Tax=Phenylobacterium sp. TaxID=1871053 RepID=UPI00121EC299|nr:hypothetical protein [Phenylobacterium sp.]THD58691.1 MAG: hypothetical protein E8A49_19430 [Phenylobacterium sp.]